MSISDEILRWQIKLLADAFAKQISNEANWFSSYEEAHNPNLMKLTPSYAC
jgi:hypothetical protein